MKPGDAVRSITSRWLEPKLYAAVLERAEAEGISRAELVKRAIAAYVAQESKA